MCVKFKVATKLGATLSSGTRVGSSPVINGKDLGGGQTEQRSAIDTSPKKYSGGPCC